MRYSKKELQLQYQGFLNSHFLWTSNAVGLYQFSFSKEKNTSLATSFNTNLRLGKLVERFVSEEITQDKTINILVENIQIQDGKTTVGELDCLLLKNNQPIHLEIVYKFYLYDKSVGSLEIDHWIGPNRRDSFSKKLTKLTNKQFPLLYHNKTKIVLDKLDLDVKKIKQYVYFKAQLFVPFSNFGNYFPLINNQCIEGFYIKETELSLFSDCKFYFPTKHNWLVKPYTAVTWLNFKSFYSKLTLFLSEKNSPLCWVKKPNGELLKFFVVFW